MEREETLVNSFDEDSITLMPNSTSALQEKKNYRPASFMNTDAQNVNKIQQTKVKNKRIRQHNQVGLFWKSNVGLTLKHQCNVPY